jgi:hypothetical protein
VLWFLCPSREVALKAVPLASALCDFGAETDGGVVVVRHGRKNIGVLWLLANAEYPEALPGLPEKFRVY